MKTADGGPAFARPATAGTRIGDPDRITEQRGMSLRDYFAGQALAGLLAAPDYGPQREEGETNGQAISRNAYSFADSMLAEREKKGDGR